MKHFFSAHWPAQRSQGGFRDYIAARQTTYFRVERPVPGVSGSGEREHRETVFVPGARKFATSGGQSDGRRYDTR